MSPADRAAPSELGSLPWSLSLPHVQARVAWLMTRGVAKWGGGAEGGQHICSTGPGDNYSSFNALIFSFSFFDLTQAAVVSQFRSSSALFDVKSRMIRFVPWLYYFI